MNVYVVWEYWSKDNPTVLVICSTKEKAKEFAENLKDMRHRTYITIETLDVNRMTINE